MTDPHPDITEALDNLLEAQPSWPAVQHTGTPDSQYDLANLGRVIPGSPRPIHVRQKPGQKCCGQACVAMALGVTLEEAIALVGGPGRTSIHDLERALRTGHRVVMPKVNFIAGERPIMSHEAFIRQWFQQDGRRWYHWLYKRGDFIYCPDSKNPWPARKVLWKQATEGRISKDDAGFASWLTSYNPIYDRL